MIDAAPDYARLRTLAREGPPAISEAALQQLWREQAFPGDALRTAEGHTVSVLSPGWFNRQEGPDFRGAQISFNGAVHTGDVEVHLDKGGWRAHGHHIDKRYDEVILHVVCDGVSGGKAVCTSEGRQVPTLDLGALLKDGFESALEEAAANLDRDLPFGAEYGRCAKLRPDGDTGTLLRFIELAADWRMLNKARAMERRMEEAGDGQAVYESLLYACGFSQFKQQFRTIARALPYDRARQLAQYDPLLLEAALLQVAGLLPASLPEGTTAVPHFARLRALRRDELEGLRSLPLAWRRVGVRPANNPERRLSGVARFAARTASDGLVESLSRVWLEHEKPLAQRRALEALFPRAVGFWAEHCTWAGKKLDRPTAPLGGGRIRSIIGNVFVPASIAVARRERDRPLEERLFAFFAALPKESDNHVLKRMVPRVFGDAAAPRLNFRLQQGLLQMYQDWCEPNPSCRNCLALNYLGLRDTDSVEERA